MGGNRSSALTTSGQSDSHVRDVRKYYHTLESVLGYRLMVRGVKHFGFHDDPEHPLPIHVAQINQNNTVAKRLDLSSRANILETGCGEGSAANYIAQKYGWKITGVDLLPRNIARAKKQALRNNNQNSFMVADFMNLPFDDNSFDGAYAMETLVHAPNAVELFKGIHRVLKPGAKLVFCEYSMNPRDTLTANQKRLMTIMNTAGAMPALEQFNPGVFPKILQSAGFHNIKIDDMTPNIIPTLKYFYDRARLPNKIIKKLHLEKHFVNAYCAAEVYESFLRSDKFLQYNLVTATRDK